MSFLDTADACAIAEHVRKALLGPGQVAEHFLAQTNAREPAIQAFAALDAQCVRKQAQCLGSPQINGLLAGVPVGVKDIIDTGDHPTAFYSPIYAHNRPSRDAHVVALLRQAGAVIMGKTHTTEFAYMHTGPTRNPHDLRRTPGSSSAGSAAGMAAGFFALALGTQTAGSLLKPASYCGLYAFKPSHGLVSLEGVKPLAPSFDTMGWYGRSVRELVLPYVLLMAAYALWRRAWKEAAAWALLIAVFLGLLAWHLSIVSAQVLPSDPPSPSWFALRGLWGWTSNVALASNLRFFPHWIAAPLVLLAVLGWAGWKSPAGSFGALLFLGYGVMFMIAGRNDNFYWGALIGPALMIGFAYVPMALKGLWVASRFRSLP